MELVKNKKPIKKNEKILKTLVRNGDVIRGGKDNYRFANKTAQLFPGYRYFSKEDFLRCPIEKRLTELWGEDAMFHIEYIMMKDEVSV